MLNHWYIDTLIHCYIDVLLHWCISALYVHFPWDSLVYISLETHFIDEIIVNSSLLMEFLLDHLILWIDHFLDEILVRSSWYIDTLVRWYVDTLVHWYIGTLCVHFPWGSLVYTSLETHFINEILVKSSCWWNPN